MKTVYTLSISSVPVSGMNDREPLVQGKILQLKYDKAGDSQAPHGNRYSRPGEGDMWRIKRADDAD
jgi:hypothetical protein